MVSAVEQLHLGRGLTASGVRLLPHALLTAAGTIWLAATLAFFALRVVPGDGLTQQLLESGADAETIAARQAHLGLDQPVGVQYTRYLGGLLQGDLGISLLDGREVEVIVLEQLPPTVTLAGAAMLIAIVGGILLGMTSTLNIRYLSIVSRGIIVFGLSAPIYFTGVVAIFIFATWLHLFPGSGAGRLDQLILPGIILGFHSAAPIAQIVESALTANARETFIVTAHSKGLRPLSVTLNHAFRAGLPPIIGVITLEAGYLLSGAVITETVFSRPGIGRVLIDAALRQDYPVVQGVVLWSVLIYLALTAIGELASALVDPRLRESS